MTDMTAYGEKNTTVVGHSYGSTVVARAAARLDMPADNLVFVGSPGIGNAVETPVPGPPDRDALADYRLWYGQAQDDLVSKVGGIAHGASPREYGAERFSTDGASGHSGYYQQDTKSLENLARVTRGEEPT